MIKSMTGFGKASSNLKGKKITVEIRSLNSKQLDLNVRIPGFLREKESELRSLLSKSCERGKIDFSIFLETEKENGVRFINKKLAKQYFAEMSHLAEEFNAGREGLLELVLKMPDVMKPEPTELEAAQWKAIKNCIGKAIAEFDAFRIQEGKILKKEFENRVTLIMGLLKKTETLDKMRIPALRKKLRTGMMELKEQVNENRFEQELIFYLEKLDITEEKVRLKTHCDYFLKTLKEASPGRKLNFISQEIGREINTIGSKANDAGIQKLVVQMKDELEKIKEQLNNVL